MEGREIILRTLNKKNPARIGRQLWLLPTAADNHKDAVEKLQRDFPDDIICIGCSLAKRPQLTKGHPYEIGEYVDDFGCRYQNIQKGIVGEVKKPLVKEEDWSDSGNIHIPEEWLSFDIPEVNGNILKYAPSQFTMAGMCVRPFERLQFIRGTENLYIDFMERPGRMLEFIERLHDFYCRLLKKWAQTNVDSLQFMDDWGTQRGLLINPALWREMFLPLYRDYIDIGHKAGKKVFMHSDGHILDILPHLIDAGLDAVNSQLFCMGLDNLKQFKGKITFWGEIDRQHLLPYGSRQDIQGAVQKVYDSLYDNGGVIAQCEFGAGAKPENVYTVFETWNKFRT